MLYSILKLRLKQAVGEFGFRAILKFLAPDFLVGIFLAISNGNRLDENFTLRLGIIACGIALFTSVVETRKLFFSGGDLEKFYFVQPTKVSRLASLLAMVILNLVIISTVVLPSILLTFADSDAFTEIVFISISAACFSSMIYLLSMFAVASLPRRVADFSLTILQILMALVLLSIFQLPLGAESVYGVYSFFAAWLLYVGIPAMGLLISCLFFISSPFQEKLISKLNQYSSVARIDLVSLVERVKSVTLIRSKEEEAGFIFFLSNIFRNSSFRLTTIGIAATPIMVAIYWLMHGIYFLTFDTTSIFFSAQSVAPIASLVVSGVLAHYFLSQNILSSKDYEAKWMLEIPRAGSPRTHTFDGTNAGFNVGKFLLGIRKSFLLTVHIPMVIVIFFIILSTESFVPAMLSALTFYFLTHVAASWFFIIQKRLPFSLPFTQIGSTELFSMVSMFVYSFLVIIILYFSYGNLENLLIVNAFGFILVSLLEVFFVKIVNNRVKFV